MSSVSIFQRPACMPLGFRGGCIPTKSAYQDTALSSNIKTALSWIPIIGAIIGAIMFAQAYKAYSQNKEELFEEGQKAQLKSEMGIGIALMATFGCMGPIKFAIDMIVTTGRCCSKDAEDF